jgi:hypothetical protein
MDHKYYQLVLFPTELEEESELSQQVAGLADEPFEQVTQQQMARLAALVLLLGFSIFLVGYWLGQSAQREAFDRVVPGELYSAFYTGGSQVETACSEYARVATLEEAVTLGSRLKDNYTIVPRTSRSVSGGEVTWYQVILSRKGYSHDDQ